MGVLRLYIQGCSFSRTAISHVFSHSLRFCLGRILPRHPSMFEVQWLTPDGKRPPKMTLAEAGNNPFTWWRANVITPVHSMRIPLRGRAFYMVASVYGALPLVGGYYLMEWAKDRSVENYGKGGVKLSEPGAIGSAPTPTRDAMIRNQKATLQDILNRSKEQKLEK